MPAARVLNCEIRDADGVVSTPQITVPTGLSDDGRIGHVFSQALETEPYPEPSFPEMSEYDHPVVALALGVRDDLRMALVEWLIDAGCSWAEAGDYAATVRAVGGDYTHTAWGERRGVSQQGVSDNVSGAREQIADELPKPVPAHPEAMGTIEDASGG